MDLERVLNSLVWQIPDGQWCCAQARDVKTYATKEEALRAARRSVAATKARLSVIKKRAEKSQALAKRYREVGAKK